MASKRKLRRQSCEGKIRYVSAHDGMGVIASMRRNGQIHTPMDVYRCTFCKGFHIGHRRGTKARAIRMMGGGKRHT